MPDMINISETPVRVCAGATVMLVLPGQRRHVSPSMVKEAAAAGLVLAEPGDEAGEPAKSSVAKLDENDIEQATRAQIQAAFEKLVAEGDDSKFTSQGVPKVSAVASIVGMRLKADVVAREWEKYTEGV